MKILVRLPTWLGDAIMATPFLAELRAQYADAQFCFVGSAVSAALLRRDFPTARFVVDNTKQSKIRLLALAQLAKELGRFDIAFSLQNSFLSALLLYLTRSPIRIGTANEMRSILLSHSMPKQKNLHQVQRYYELLRPLGLGGGEAGELVLFASRDGASHPTKRVGINTGGAFGSAKRWSKTHFVATARALLMQGVDVVLVGGTDDVPTNIEIERELAHQNLHNLTGKTSIEQLIDTIAGLNLFITNDSGPMHIAAALEIPLIALFGPTDYTETSPWKAQNAILLSKNLPCAPCKKRSCPLGHHACMETLQAQEVLTHAFRLLALS